MRSTHSLHGMPRRAASPAGRSCLQPDKTHRCTTRTPLGFWGSLCRPFARTCKQRHAAGKGGLLMQAGSCTTRGHELPALTTRSLRPAPLSRHGQAWLSRAQHLRTAAQHEPSSHDHAQNPAQHRSMHKPQRRAHLTQPPSTSARPYSHSLHRFSSPSHLLHSLLLHLRHRPPTSP